LSLYVVSSFLLIALVGYWYFVSQSQMLKSKVHYEMEHIVDQEASKIIYAHMQHGRYRYTPSMDEIGLSMMDLGGKVIHGQEINAAQSLMPGFYQVDGVTMLVSDAPKGHLGIALIVAKTTMLSREIRTLGQYVIGIVLLVMLFVAIIAWMLSKIFMRPLRERVSQIEAFINDVTHELNTPITALGMATDQASRSGACPEKVLNHISISTKQLHDIYRSLSYLNFSTEPQTDEVIDVAESLRESIAYYTPLAEIKKIDFAVEIEACLYQMPAQQLSLLFGNLIGNAIKYSPARSTIRFSLKNSIFVIEDEGIGIKKAQQKEVFEKFKRGTTQSGGFGVGLSVVRSISQRYGIKIALDSDEGKGVRFTLHFINKHNI